MGLCKLCKRQKKALAIQLDINILDQHDGRVVLVRSVCMRVSILNIVMRSYGFHSNRF